MISPRIAVVGLGNLMRTDDAVGMLALRQLQQRSQLPEGVVLIEGGTLGLELLYPLSGVTHLLALDAIDAGEAPGTVLRFAGEAVADMPVTKSVHLLGFSDLIGAMMLTGDAPQQIVVLGVQPERIAWGTELTKPVQAVLGKLAAAALEQVRAWSWEIAAQPVCCCEQKSA
ncbi:MAG TPA: HyaD/HybD family hydrogenase maturation endopeptidase [Acidobacteriaceae bacterium]|nr:HyaD/HybD family hydrogenase maturation endopeptidase [Acidobacteriaceae bacterium]